MNLIIKAMQIIATALLAAVAMLHLATFFFSIPGFSAVALVLLIASGVLAALTFQSLYHFTLFRFYSFPFRSRGVFAAMAENRERNEETESRIYSHISRKWSAILGSLGGYLFINGMLCLLLHGAQASKVDNDTVEAIVRGELIADCYIGRFLSGCALLPATFVVMGFHVIFPRLLEESQHKHLGISNVESTRTKEALADK